MTKILEAVNAFVWGAPALFLILSVGCWFSIRTGFAQLRLFPQAVRMFCLRLRGEGKTETGISPFQALCTALAATVGTGNLAGVAGAIAIGGPGAIFWMWISAILGMVLKFGEATLAVRYRSVEKDGSFRSGPMQMIENGLGKKWHFLAGIYCFFGVVAAFGVGNSTQINAVLTGINGVLESVGAALSPLGKLVLGGILALLVLYLLLGGAGRIGSVAELLVPFAAISYILLSVVALMICSDRIPHALAAIVSGAFSPRAATGGAVGSILLTLRIGISRGVFTNEAGMGTAAIAHGSADVAHPVEQGLLGIIEVFLDTMVICTMTALVILCSGTEIPYGTDEGLALTTRAFSAIFGDWVVVLITLDTYCFAFATVLGWSLYGGRCAQYLFGDSAWKHFAWLQGLTVLASACLNTGTIWLLAEIVNGLMAIPNLIVLAILLPELIYLLKTYSGGISANGGTNEYFHQRKSLRTLSHEKVPSLRCEGTAAGKEHLSFEYRSAGSGHSSGILRCDSYI